MKILLVSVTTPLHAAGGFENVIWRLGCKLQAQGHEVHMVTGRLPRSKRQEQYDTVDGIHMHYAGLPYYRRQWYPITFYLESSWLIRGLQRRYHFDVIHSNQAAIYGYLKTTPRWERPPVLMTAHGTQQTELFSSVGGLLKTLVRIVRFAPLYPIERKVFRDADMLLPISRWAKAKVLSEQRIPPERMQIVHNSVNDAFYQVGDLDGTEKQNAKKILYIGAVIEAKGLFVLARAFQRVLAEEPNAHLDIVGGGPIIPALQQFFLDANISDKAVVHGRVSEDEVRRFYQEATLSTLPSLRQEGLPLTILESWSCGTPVVASRIGGIPAIVSNQRTGLLVEPGDEAGLTSAFLTFFRDQEIYNQIRDRNLQDVLNVYSENAQVRAVEKVYRSVQRV
jgi:glycosyltransferase involved in cell wall biosynthesis